jgi:hypothetical protein
MNPMNQAETAAAARGYADFEVRSFENPYVQSHMRRCWQVGFTKAAREFQRSTRSRRVSINFAQHQAVGR